jgi:anti-sigma regulatory factor (Ser/Thr protein kinase)
MTLGVPNATPNQGLRLGLKVAPGPRAPSQVRAHLSALRRYVKPDVHEQIELLVSELVTNSVRHGGLDEGDWVEIRVTATNRTVRVRVVDPGPGFAPPSPPDPASHETSGWGLYLVDQIADRWGVARNGNTVVWFELDCR